MNLSFASKEWQGFWKLSSQILNQFTSTSTISLSLSFFFGVLEGSSSSLSSSDESYSEGSSFPLISLHSYLSPMVTFEISPDISLPIPTPEHVGVIPESLFIMIFELGRAVAMLYWSHQLFTATKSLLTLNVIVFNTGIGISRNNTVVKLRFRKVRWLANEWICAFQFNGICVSYKILREKKFISPCLLESEPITIASRYQEVFKYICQNPHSYFPWKKKNLTLQKFMNGTETVLRLSLPPL